MTLLQSIVSFKTRTGCTGVARPSGARNNEEAPNQMLFLGFILVGGPMDPLGVLYVVHPLARPLTGCEPVLNCEPITYQPYVLTTVQGRTLIKILGGALLFINTCLRRVTKNQKKTKQNKTIQTNENINNKHPLPPPPPPGLYGPAILPDILAWC